MNIAIIQARMSSKRLPGKALLPIESRPMIYYIIKRAQNIRGVEKIVLATSRNMENNELANYAKSLGIDVFRGDEDNVLERFYIIAKQNKAKNILRLTGDNPLIDFTALSILLERHQKENSDYSCIKGLPTGASGDIFSFNALKISHEKANGKELCDHIDLYILENQNKFNIACYELTRSLSSYRWTVDDQQDINRIKDFFSTVNKKCGNTIEKLNTKYLLELIQSLGFIEKMQPLRASVSEKNLLSAELIKKINKHMYIRFEEIFP